MLIWNINSIPVHFTYVEFRGENWWYIDIFMKESTKVGVLDFKDFLLVNGIDFYDCLRWVTLENKINS